MRILVSGGTGVLGRPTVDALLARGHAVRLLTRHARDDARDWGGGVEPWEGAVDRVDTLSGAADGCDVVLHLAGIVREDPPGETFAAVNVRGTANLLAESARAGTPRFVYISSLGADVGASEYHRSKREAEALVREYPGRWTICRPGNVYGPGDEVVSLLLKVMRALPVVPVIGGGDQPVQPVWAGDAGDALAAIVERDDLAGQVLLLAGPERTTPAELMDRIERLEGMDPARVPVPEWMARFGTAAFEKLGLTPRFTFDQVTMLTEGNAIREGEHNALPELLDRPPTSLDEGLRLLIDALPERLPDRGVGPLSRHRYWADINDCGMTPEALFRCVCERFDELPVEGLLEVERSDGRTAVLEEGATVTLEIPVRGRIQVRVEEVDALTATAVTLEGHPLSGMIRFLVEPLADGAVRFEVRSYTRRSNPVDDVAMRTLGRPLQQATWQSVVEEVVELSGGRAEDGVQTEAAELDEGAAARVEEWTEELVRRRRREHPLPGE